MLFAGIKRLHDFDGCGWWRLICWAPLVNLILWLWFSFARGQKGLNKYGAVNSGSPFPFLHPQDSYESLPIEGAERQGRGLPLTAIDIGVVVFFGVTMLVF